jgi:hypothetical protein
MIDGIADVVGIASERSGRAIPTTSVRRMPLVQTMMRKLL